MRHPSARTLLALALLRLTTLHADPAVGATREEVLRELGKPTAAFASESREVMMFSRGKVMLENGRVTKVDLKSEAQFAADERRSLEEEARRQQQAERLREERRRAAEAFAERKKIGDGERDKLVGAPEWLKFTGEERLELLARFAQKYPEADLALELRLAKAKRDRENETRDRIQGLESRLAAAERRAAEAEARAEDAYRRATLAENRAENAARSQTVYLPPPIVTTTCIPADHQHRTVVRVGNATLVTRDAAPRPGNPTCPPQPPAKPRPAPGTKDKERAGETR